MDSQIAMLEEATPATGNANPTSYPTTEYTEEYRGHV